MTLEACAPLIATLPLEVSFHILMLFIILILSTTSGVEFISAVSLDIYFFPKEKGKISLHVKGRLSSLYECNKTYWFLS